VFVYTHILKYRLIYTSNRMVKQTEFEILKSNILQGMDLDAEIKKYVSQQFSLDKKHKNILLLLSQQSATEYQLGKLGKKFNLDRDSVRRRLLGTPSLLGLQDNYFVFTDEEDFKTGKKTKQYSLSLKGVIASLSETKFKNTIQVKTLRKDLVSFTGNNLLSDLIILYATIHTALVLLWAGLHFFKFNEVMDFPAFFHNSYLKQILFDKQSYPFVSDTTVISLNGLRVRLLATNFVIMQIIKDSVKDKHSKIYENLELDRFLTMEEKEKTVRLELVENWHYFVNSAMLSFKPEFGSNINNNPQNVKDTRLILEDQKIKQILKMLVKGSSLKVEKDFQFGKFKEI